MANGWTPERRARQAEMIRQWRPWEKSTGPRTRERKATRETTCWPGRISRDATELFDATGQNALNEPLLKEQEKDQGR